MVWINRIIVSDGIVSYYCERCKKNRKTIVLPELHKKNLERFNNGLVEYSDLHICVDEIYGVSNINIDAHYNVRGVEYQKLPEAVREDSQTSSVQIPTPNSTRITKTIYIRQIIPDLVVRLVFKDFKYKYALEIGRIPSGEQEIERIVSDSGDRSFDIYQSEIELTDNFRSWLVVLLDLMESHPPVRLGVIIEAFIHVFDSANRGPESIDEKILRDLLTSHEITLELLNDDPALLEDLSSSFTDDEIGILKTIVASLKLNPGSTILQTAGLLTGFIKFIMNLYLLEKYGVIQINRPESVPVPSAETIESDIIS